jgi:hypothetical protein
MYSPPFAIAFAQVVRQPKPVRKAPKAAARKSR